MLLTAIILMNLALVFYSWAVFGTRGKGLHRKYLFIFAIGLICDYLGTREMNLYGNATGYWPREHYLIGLASLVGMAVHFLLALMATLATKGAAISRFFHRVSLGIYLLWLVSFFSGAIAGIINPAT
jgi:uncharacterized repeat protein (TIGR03987 family)